MVKILPVEFPPLDVDKFQVGGPIAARDYKALFERSHHLWALNRGRVQGWEWNYLATRSNPSVNLWIGPNLNDYQPVLRPARVVKYAGRDGYICGFKFFAIGCGIRAKLYTLDTGSMTQVLVGPTQWVEASNSAISWRTLPFLLSSGINGPDGRARPIVFRFEIRKNPDFTSGSILLRRIQPFEAGINELNYSHLP